MFQRPEDISMGALVSRQEQQTDHFDRLLDSAAEDEVSIRVGQGPPRRTDGELPGEMYVNIFEFLSLKDRARATRVCRSFRQHMYTPFLWPKLDMSRYAHKVSDSLLTRILDSQRFSEVVHMSLEGCEGLSPRALEAVPMCCPLLHTLLLTDCAGLDGEEGYERILWLVDELPKLKKLELYGAVSSLDLAREVKERQPKLDLGFFWIQYIADRGLMKDVPPEEQADEAAMQLDLDVRPAEIELGRVREPSLDRGIGVGLDEEDEKHDFDAQGYALAPVSPPEDDEDQEESEEFIPAPCRYQNVFQGGGCWGRVQGRMIFSNRIYSRRGNYPEEVWYSCRSHDLMDYREEEVTRCEVCQRLFREASTWSEVICRVCFDKKGLQDASNWTTTDSREIGRFNYANLLSQTLTMADRRNLPTSLRRMGHVACNLDYRSPFDNVDIADTSSVPSRVFWLANQATVDDQVGKVKKCLKRAKRKGHTRALLVYDRSERVEVLADDGVLFDGEQGEEFVKLTLMAWRNFWCILLPVLAILAASVYFVSVFSSVNITTASNNALLVTTRPPSQPSPMFYTLLVAGLGLLLAAFVYMMYRHRALCEDLFRKFLVLDILVIVSLGTAFLVYVLFATLAPFFPLDLLTLVVCVWNLGVVSLVAFYSNVPDSWHRVLLVALNAVMAIMIAITLRWFVLFFIIFVALGDILSLLRPNLHVFTPFLIPAEVELAHPTPRVFYEVRGLRLRASDFMFYGMMMALSTARLLPMLSACVMLVAGFLVCVFVLPFFSKNIRPLPVALALVIFCSWLAVTTLEPYMEDEARRLHFVHA